MNLLNELSRPLAIDASGIPFLQSVLNGRAAPRVASTAAGSELSIVGSTAIVPLSGVMLRSCDELYQAMGFCSCAGVADQLETAAENPNVKRILLSVDSPGGSVAGTIELANLVSEVNRQRKPVDAFIGGQGCSAAFWVASGCRSISSTPSSIVGSVGVLSVHVDATSAQEAAGYRVEIFRSGPLKATGALGEKLSAEQRAHIQASIEEAFGLFRAHLAINRPGLSPTVFSGETFMGDKARLAGLVDSIASSLKSVLSRPESVSAQAPAADFQSLVKRGMHAGKTKCEAIAAAVRSYPKAHREYLQRGGGQL